MYVVAVIAVYVRALAALSVFVVASTLSSTEQSVWMSVYDSLKVSQGGHCNSSTYRNDPCICSSGDRYITCSGSSTTEMYVHMGVVACVVSFT